VALIRGVGLCEQHFQVVDECAADQGVNPTSLARQVIVALLRSGYSSEATRQPPPREPPRRRTPPGFYWVYDDDRWIIIEVAGDSFRRMGEPGQFQLADHEFEPVVPIHLPPAYARDAELRSRQQSRRDG